MWNYRTGYFLNATVKFLSACFSHLTKTFFPTSNCLRAKCSVNLFLFYTDHLKVTTYKINALAFIILVMIKEIFVVSAVYFIEALDLGVGILPPI